MIKYSEGRGEENKSDKMVEERGDTLGSSFIGAQVFHNLNFLLGLRVQNHDF